jgi:hypothetical protein
LRTWAGHHHIVQDAGAWQLAWPIVDQTFRRSALVPPLLFLYAIGRVLVAVVRWQGG